MKRFLLAAVFSLAAFAAHAQQTTVVQPTSGGGGSGCTVTGTTGGVVNYNGSSGCNVSSKAVLATPASGVAGLTLSDTLSTGNGTTNTFPYIYINQGAGPTTFNTGGTELGINAPSAFAGLFIDFHLNGGVSLFSVNQFGGLTLNSNVSAAGTITAGATGFVGLNGRGGFTSTGAGVFQVGNTDAASPVAQTIQAQSVVAGTSNTAGVNTVIQGSRGTGTGVGGSVSIATAPAGTTGTAQNAAINALTVDTTQFVILGAGTPTCGTGCASIATGATNQRMVITTGSAVTSISWNFSKTLTTTPICNATPIGAVPITLGFSSAPTTSGGSIVAASALTAAQISVTCQ